MGEVGECGGPITSIARKRRSLESPCSCLGIVEFISLPEAIHHYISGYLDAAGFVHLSQASREMLQIYRAGRSLLVLGQDEEPDDMEQGRMALVSLLRRQSRLVEVRVVRGALWGLVESLRSGQPSTIKHLHIDSPREDDLWRFLRLVLGDGGSVLDLTSLKVSSCHSLAIQLLGTVLASSAFPRLAHLQLPSLQSQDRAADIVLLDEALRDRSSSCCRPFASVDMEVGLDCPAAVSQLLSLPCFSSLQELRLSDAPPPAVADYLLLRHAAPTSPLRVLALEDGWELRSRERRGDVPSWDLLAHALTTGAAPGLQVLCLSSVGVRPSSLQSLAWSIRSCGALRDLVEISLDRAMPEVGNHIFESFSKTG